MMGTRYLDVMDRRWVHAGSSCESIVRMRKSNVVFSQVLSCDLSVVMLT